MLCSECDENPEHTEEGNKEKGHLTQFCWKKLRNSFLVVVMSMLSLVALIYWFNKFLHIARYVPGEMF